MFLDVNFTVLYLQKYMVWCNILRSNTKILWSRMRQFTNCQTKEKNSTWNFLFTASQGSPDRCQLHSFLSGAVLMSACIGWAASSSEGGLFPYLSHSLAPSLHPSCPISLPDSLNILTYLCCTLTYGKNSILWPITHSAWYWGWALPVPW